jgi:hypothetical protein
MNTHPEKWYIQVTPENYDEVKAWWLKQVEKSGWQGRHFHETCIALSVHPIDDSYYWIGDESYLNKCYPSYKKITIEQFRQITNPMNTLPANWYIEVTQENKEELDRWRQQVATSHRKYTLKAGHTLLSRHHRDGSYFYCDNASVVRDHEGYADYQEITLEQFRQITNQTPKPMTKSIQISRELLNEYYDAANTPQREYLAEHFKLDGTTTDEAIRGLYDLACSTWKPRIKKNHPECFEDEKHFDFSAMADKDIVEPKVAEALGLSKRFIEVRNGSNPKIRYRSFYLSTEYNWELVNDNAEGRTPIMALIPTKK